MNLQKTLANLWQGKYPVINLNNNYLINLFAVNFNFNVTCTVSKFNNVKNLMQTAARHRKENKHNTMATFPIDLMPRHKIMKIRIQTIETLNASYLYMRMEKTLKVNK